MRTDKDQQTGDRPPKDHRQTTNRPTDRPKGIHGRWLTCTLLLSALMRRAVPTVAAMLLLGPYLSSAVLFSTVKTCQEVITQCELRCRP